ncbi:MAG TPA: metallophosphoesterase [Polyangia bacterium]|nr:metallophosphoesterase [Polyangia bacterium]
MPIQGTRRDILRLMGVGGVVFASGLAGGAVKKKKSSVDSDFFFLQLSDTHWGYTGPANPEAENTLKKVVATVNGVAARPDFIVFTGDLTHTTDDGAVRRKRMAEFKTIVGTLNNKDLRLMPGEHDASLDVGAAYQENFGPTHYTFDHKGVHFIALDNVSDPGAIVGTAQIDWLAADLKKVRKDAPIVVLTHRPLFDLYPQWDWATKDGTKVIDVLLPHKNVTVFYGHIHQEHHHETEHIKHHAAKSLVFPLPAPGSVPKRVPVPWDPKEPFKGLGYRQIDEAQDGGEPRLTEFPVVAPPA